MRIPRPRAGSDTADRRVDWYAIRLKANAVLERHIAHLLKRPMGHPLRKPKVIYRSFRYQAKSWDRARRVVAKIEWHVGSCFHGSDSW